MLSIILVKKISLSSGFKNKKVNKIIIIIIIIMG